jgi:hypothetical protein
MRTVHPEYGEDDGPIGVRIVSRSLSGNDWEWKCWCGERHGEYQTRADAQWDYDCHKKWGNNMEGCDWAKRNKPQIAGGE